VTGSPPVAALPAKTGTCPLYSLDELRTLSLPEPEVIVEEMLHMGETILLVGRPKVGKSRLVGQLALALASGRPFLGKAVNKVRRVLLLDLENRPAFIQRRFALMAQADEADKNIFVVAPESLSENTLNLNPPWRP